MSVPDGPFATEQPEDVLRRAIEYAPQHRWYINDRPPLRQVFIDGMLTERARCTALARKHSADWRSAAMEPTSSDSDNQAAHAAAAALDDLAGALEGGNGVCQHEWIVEYGDTVCRHCGWHKP